MSSTDAPDPAAALALRRAAAADPAARTYHGRPVVKPPEWTWEVPWYLFAGGLAGASTGLSTAARVAGLSELASATRRVAGAAGVASPLLLVMDLGRPQRFHHMLRVCKPTSAMSVGSWILAAYAPAAFGAAALDVLGRLPRLRALADGTAALLAMPMATYTAALLSDSSIPVWSEAAGDLPFVFGSGAAASAGAAATVLAPEEAAPARRLALAGALGELLTARRMRRGLGELGAVYQEGDAGRWERAANACTGLGTVVMAAAMAGAARGAVRGVVRRSVDRTAALLLLVGAACQRWAVYRAGFQSAWDPRHTVGPQRERVERGESYGGADSRGPAPDRGAA